MEEWTLLTTAPVAIGLGVIASEIPTHFELIKEISAIFNILEDARQIFAKSPLVLAVLEELHSNPPSLFKLYQQEQSEVLQLNALETARKVVDLLTVKTSPQTTADFKHFLTLVAQDVAEAHKEINSQGVKQLISDAEAVMLIKIASILE